MKRRRDEKKTTTHMHKNHPNPAGAADDALPCAAQNQLFNPPMRPADTADVGDGPPPSKRWVLRAVGGHPQQNRCMVSDFGDVGVSGAAALAEPEI